MVLLQYISKQTKEIVMKRVAKSIMFVNSKSDQNNPYIKLNQEALRNALSNLSSSAFKVYSYLQLFKNIPADFKLSASSIMSATGMSRATTYTAITELKTLGYLMESSPDTYMLYENVQKIDKPSK